MSLDSIVQVTATFYDRGITADAGEIEDHRFHSEDWEKCLEDLDPEAPEEEKSDEEDELDIFTEMSPCSKHDVRLTKDLIGFDLDWVTEGDCDYPYMSAMDAESSDGDLAYAFEHFVEDFVRIAKERREMHNEARRKHTDEKSKRILDPVDEEYEPCRRLRFMIIVGYHAEQDYWGEWDCEFEWLGELTKDHLYKIIK